MNSDLAKKIKALNILADSSLSMLSLGDHKWQVHTYRNNTPLGSDPFHGETLEEALDKALMEVVNNVKNTV